MFRIDAFRFCPLLLMMACAPPAIGLTIRDDRSFLQYEQSGIVQFDSTGRLETNTADGVGSGTLIAPNWVFSADHLSNNVSTFTASDGTTRSVTQRFNYGAQSATDGGDFSLFQLSSSINTVQIASLHDPSGGVLYSDLLTQIDGLTATYAGEGLSGTGLTGATAGRRLLAGTNIIDTVGYNGVANIVSSDFDAPSPQPSVTDLETALALFDSGGGLWVDLGDGPVLIGVHSFVAKVENDPFGMYGQLNFSTVLTDDAYNWIQSTVPEPSSMALLFAGGAMLLRRRR